MVAITKTNEIISESNYTHNNAQILITRKLHSDQLLINWKKYVSISWKKYQIKETDMRAKTATFTSPNYFDLTTGVFCVLITSHEHEDFGGILLKVTYDHETNLYEYQCQDFSRVYQSKFDLISSTKSVHRILQNLITLGSIPLRGSVSNSLLKSWKKVLSGLRPAYQYDQKYWGSIIKFNPMTEKPHWIIRDKSYIEAIRDIIFGSGAYIDVYFDKYGIIHIEPYTKDDFFNTGLYLTTSELSKFTQTFDTTNIITGVSVYNSDKTKLGVLDQSSDFIDIDLSGVFGILTTSITSKESPPQPPITFKKSITKTKTSNPYNTKKKVVYLNSDNIKGKSADRKFLEDIAKILRSHGWKTKIIGVGPNTHTERYMTVKNGVWFCVYGGADGAVFKECAGKNSYTNKLKKLGSRTVIGMRQGGDIRKGGKYYKWLPRAHDDNYSPSSYRGVSYPLKMLTKAKVPIMYGSTAKQMASKFLAGGDNKEAC